MNRTTKSCKQKKQRAIRKITGDWPDDKIKELIHFVEMKPELWDIGSSSSNYRIAKPQSWQEIATQLGKQYDWQDCRLKWQNLRVFFMKIVKRQLESTTGYINYTKPRKILWRFYSLMQFLILNRSGSGAQQNLSDCNSNFSESDKPLNLDTETTNHSCSTLISQQNADVSEYSQQNVDICEFTSNSIKQESFQPLELLAGTSTATPTPTTPQLTVRNLTNSQPAQQNMQLKTTNNINVNDEHACFGNFIAAELRSLPPERSFALKHRLNRTILQYWDEMVLEQAETTVAVAKTEVFESN